MTSFETRKISNDVLASIGAEAINELDSYEPLCLNELRSATQAEFRYKIIGEIDKGGMKSIFKAVDQQTHREVALAFIKTEGLSEKAVRYFINEAWVTARLEHPNIVPVYDVGISPDGSPYFAMKLLTGQTLQSIIDKLREADSHYQSKFTHRHLLEIFIKICDAISYAHTRCIIHLDLKPENIQVSDFGQVLVLDWGIASVLRHLEDTNDQMTTPLDEISQTVFGTIKGTPGYIAPELSDGQFTPDKKADIYGLGAILFSLLTYRKTKGEASLTYLDIDVVPSALCSVVRKAMQNDPECRYESVSDLQADVEAYLTGHATQAEDAGFIRQQLLLIKRNYRFFTTIAVSLLVLVLVVTIAFIRVKMGESRAIKSEQLARKSEQQARKSEQHAIKQEVVAKQLLKKYKQERIERERREKTSYKHYSTRAYVAFDQCRFDDALRELDLAIKMDPDKDYAYKTKMDVLIALQKFQEIAKDTRYKKLPQYTYRQRYKLALRYSQVKDDSEILTDSQLLEYFKDLYRYKIVRRSTLLTAVFYTINRGKTFPQQQELIQEAALSLFPQSLIRYDSSVDRLTIKTHSDNILALMSGLRLKQLDLSGAKFHTYRPLSTLKQLEYLKLKNSTILKPMVFESLTKLKYLNLENTLVDHFKILKNKAVPLEYLNIARTFISNYPKGNVAVTTLNAVEAFEASLLKIASYSNPPKTILLTPAQLEKTKGLSALCERRGIKLRLYNSADDVREEEFFSGF